MLQRVIIECTTNNTTVSLTKLNSKLSGLLLKRGWFRDYVMVIEDPVNTTEIPLTFTQACAVANVILDIRSKIYTKCAECERKDPDDG
jgi:hypothetical protein